MNKDPYSVLGVSRSASDDEIKKAYRALARKYHPDNYTDSNMAELAEEKMKDINAAYDAIQAERSGKGSTSSGYTNYGGGTSSDPKFNEIRMMINQRRYSEAEIRLDSMSQADRNAEWNFLKACVLAQRGHIFDAQRYLETACYMDPDNEEYRRFRDQLKNASSSYRGGYNQTYNTNGSSMDDVCTICETLWCLNCCCSALGGGRMCC